MRSHWPRTSRTFDLAAAAEAAGLRACLRSRPYRVAGPVGYAAPELVCRAVHRDLYGGLVFPLQVVIGQDEPGVDHTGGDFLLVEQRPRAQSRGSSSLLQQGHALIFTTRDRPVKSARGWSAAPVRHGVSTVRSGIRHTLGLVFHDAA